MSKNNDDYIIDNDDIDTSELDTIEYDTSYQGTVLQELLKEARKYPVLSTNEQKELAVRAQKGDIDAQNKLVNHNIRLILSRAYRYYRANATLDVMDLFQEGSMGLIRSIRTYDYTLGAFSTYAIAWIDQAIGRAITNTKDTIRIPVHLQDKLNKYREILSYNIKYGLPPLSENELCDELGITKDTLKKIIEIYKTVPVSLDAKVKDDSDTEQANFVPFHENGYERAEDLMVQNETFKLINSLLKPHEFYIVYHRILSDEQSTLEDLGEEFGVTRERIRQIEAKALKKIKPYFEKNEQADRMRQSRKSLAETLNSKPISVDYIVLYFILNKKGFNSYQKYMFYELYLSIEAISDDTLRKELHLNPDDYNLLKDDMLKKINFVFSKKEQFFQYRKMKLNELGLKIFSNVEKPALEKDLASTLEKLKVAKGEQIKAEKKKAQGKRKYVRKIENYSKKKSIDHILDLSFEDFVQTYGLDGVRPKHVKHLEAFFEVPIESDEKVDPADIFMQVLGYNDYTANLSPKVLYHTFVDHKEDFTPEQRFYLEAFLFGKKSKEKFLAKYPKSTIIGQELALFDRLDAYHYNVNSFKDNTFTREKWLEVKKTHPELLTPERIEYLDMYYGVYKKPVGIKEMARRYKMPMAQMNDRVSDARSRAIIIYNNRFNTIDIDNSLYIPMLRDYRISFVPRTRQILIWFLEEGKSHKEIAELVCISSIQVSNIVTDAIRKLDNIRYGLVPYTGLSLEDIEKFFAQTEYKYTDEELNIIKDRKVNNMPIEDVTFKYNLPKTQINRLVANFNKRYDVFISRNVEFTNEDVLKEIEKEPYESILTQDEKITIAYVLGITCKYNRKGEKLSYDEIAQRMKSNRHDVYQMYYRTCQKVRLIKIGYLKHDLITVPREEIIELLKDEKLPISDKEKDIIDKIYGLSSIHKTPNQIAEEYGEKPSSIVRRYHRAIVSMFKYKEGLIEPKIIFDTDVAPLLKYFSQFDRKILIDMYRDNLTIEQMEEKYGLTFNQIVILRKRIEMTFLEIFRNPNGLYFDFDYFDEVIDNPEIPFVGDKDLVKNIFNLYTGNSGEFPLSIPQIIEKLNLDFVATSSISRAMTCIMVSVCKYRDGIKLKYIPTFEDCRTYYDNHKDELNKDELSAFMAYFKTHKKKILMEHISVPDKRMFYLLLKEKYPDLYNPDTFTKEDVINFIKTYRDMLDSEIIQKLQSQYGIMNRDLLSPEEYETMRKRIVNIMGKGTRQRNLTQES